MDQIPEDDESRGVPVVAERQQGIQGSCIAITRDGDALDLEAFRFAKVEISHHQHPSVLSPERSLRKKTEGLLIPCPDEWISHGHRAQRCDDCGDSSPLWWFLVADATLSLRDLFLIRP